MDNLFFFDVVSLKSLWVIMRKDYERFHIELLWHIAAIEDSRGE